MSKKHVTLGLLSKLCHGISFLLNYWFIALLALAFVSPIGPHLRITYEYVGSHSAPHYTRCTYIGFRGFITPDIAPDCPLVALLDTRGTE